MHEHVIVEGVCARLETEMDHYAFPTIEVFVEKHNRYSNWEARVALDRQLHHTGTQLQKAEVGFRRRLKILSTNCREGRCSDFYMCMFGNWGVSTECGDTILQNCMRIMNFYVYQTKEALLLEKIHNSDNP